MAPPSAVARNLSDEQLGELLELIADADSVELKLTVPESDHYSAAAALGMDPLEAQLRQVYFFDTPDLGLNRHGVVLRARRVQGKGGDSVVKLRPVVPTELSPRLRKRPGFGVEVDAMPGGFVCSGRLKRSVGNRDVRRVVAGERALDALFSKEQRAFLGEHAPDDLALEDLSVLGPILVLKLKFEPEGVEGVPFAAGSRPHRGAADEDAEGARVLLGAARRCGCHQPRIRAGTIVMA